MLMEKYLQLMRLSDPDNVYSAAELANEVVVYKLEQNLLRLEIFDYSTKDWVEYNLKELFGAYLIPCDSEYRVIGPQVVLENIVEWLRKSAENMYIFLEDYDTLGEKIQKKLAEQNAPKQKQLIAFWALSELKAKDVFKPLHDYEKLIAMYFFGGNYDVKDLSDYTIELNNTGTIRVYKYA